MLVVPPLIEKYREPVDVIFLAPGADQLNRSCGWRSGPLPMDDPSQRTSSISCSVDLCASKLLPDDARGVNWNDSAEFSVTIPSNVPVNPPMESNFPAVLKPRALPLALETRTFMAMPNGLPGKLALAVTSFVVFASAVNVLM